MIMAYFEITASIYTGKDEEKLEEELMKVLKKYACAEVDGYAEPELNVRLAFCPCD